MNSFVDNAFTSGPGYLIVCFLLSVVVSVNLLKWIVLLKGLDALLGFYLQVASLLRLKCLETLH